MRDSREVLASFVAALMAGDKRALATLLLSAVVAGAFISPVALLRVARKGSLYALGVLHILVGRDKKFRKPKPNPDELLSCDPASVQTVQLVFMRHGESEWNEVFNKGFGLSFPFRLLAGLLREASLLFAWDSVFIDSPLSALGRQQATALHHFLEEPRGESHGLSRGEAVAHAMLRGAAGAPPSVLASSNLRRAAETAAIALSERLRRTREPLHILSSLQEISPNVDTLALAPRHGGPPPPRVPAGEPYAPSAAANRGNKALRGRGDARLAEFAAWCFEAGGGGVIAAGHSLWFRYFLDRYLPAKAVHESRRKKIKNCALLALALQRGVGADGRVHFRIPPESVTLLYGGYH